MAKASITVPSQTYTPATRTITLPNLTSDDNGVRISLTRESWADTGSDVISGTVEGTDDAINWHELTRFNFAGGVMTNPRTGQTVTASQIMVYWPERNIAGVMTPQRPALARVNVTNAISLTTSISLNGV